MLIQTILVLIARDVTEVMSRCVMPHEVPMLQVIYGEGAVSMAGDQDGMPEVEKESVDQLFEEARTQYGEEVLRSAYFDRDVFEMKLDKLYATKKPASKKAAATAEE